jgi:hypothetical protein
MCRLVLRARRVWPLLTVLYDYESERMNHFGPESNDEESKSSTNKVKGTAVGEG